MWATGFWMIMVSVSSITEQLCKQKLEDAWTSAESERRAGVTFSGCPGTEGEGKENTAGHSTLRRFDESKLNNNIRSAGATAGNDDDVTKDCDWYSSQTEQMPPVKKHRRSFSIPGGTKSDTGLELCHIQHSQSTLNTAVLRPVAVRPRLAAGLRSDACREQAVAGKGGAASSDAVTKSSSFSLHPFSISGSCSGFYRHPATDFLGAAPPRSGFHGSGLARSVVVPAGKPTSETAFCFSTDVRQATDGVGKDSVPSLDVSSSRSGSSLIGSRSPSLVISSNSDLTLSCHQRSCAPKQCPLRTPERKTGLKRRRDDDRPTLNFFKMIETAYEREFCSSSISQQTGSKSRFKSDVYSPSVNRTPNADCSSPCSLLDSTETTRGASPASPFISLHRHFLADETDTADAGDEDTTHFTSRRNTATECNSDRSKENWKNVDRRVRDRILGSEFDLDLIENN